MRTYLLTSLCVSLVATYISVHAAPTPAGAPLIHLPPAVRKTILDAKGDSKVDSVDKKSENGELVYSVKVSKNGQQGKFTVSTDGSVSRKPVTLAETPAPVQKAIKDKTIDAKLGDITRVTDDGDVTYEVDITQGKRDREFAVDEEGVLVSEQVFIEELSVPVQKTIREKSVGGELGDITRTFEDGDPAYEIDMTKAGQDRYFAVDGDGTLLGEQVFLSELPAAVQATIQGTTMDAKLGDINKIIGDEIAYEVVMMKRNKARTFTVDEEGTLTDIEMPLEETPALVQKTIHEQLKTAKPDQITKLIDGEEITYQVEWSTNDQSQSFYVTEKGDLLGMEVELSATPAPVQATLQKQADGGSIEKIIKNVADGVVAFQADISLNGKTKTVMTDIDGELTYFQAEVELKNTPDMVHTAIDAKLGTTGKLTTITQTVEEGVASYEVEYTQDGKPQSLTLDKTGQPVPLDGK